MNPIKIHLSNKINKEILPTAPYLNPLKDKVGGKIVYHSGERESLIPIGKEEGRANLFLQTLDECFISHIPLNITPDLLWLLVVQGVAQHIKFNAEESESKLLIDNYSKIIKVREDQLLHDHSKWKAIPAKIINELKKALVDTSMLNYLTPKFSTTRERDTIAYEIGVMDIFSPYFEYWVTSLCGIPEIYLDGTLEDWERFEKNLGLLNQYELEWWLQHLISIVKKIKETIKGNIDQQFWKSIYKINEMSGGPYITGWIVKFFPYLKEKKRDLGAHSIFGNSEITKTKKIEHNYFRTEGRNPFLHQEEIPNILKLDNFHNGLSKVKFKWQKMNEVIDLELISGFIGLKQNKLDYSLKSEIGWCIKEI